jgi:hypothetical protein
MAVIARDSAASDQLVYAWPFALGPEPIEVTCNEDEIVVMCPAWVVGDRLGPGRHHWRSPDPAKPTNAYFVLIGPVEVPFDGMASFVIPSTQQPVRVRAQGSLLARCMDPGMLVSQFVGLPFDHVNDGLVRSVAASVERLLARVLVRRVLAGGTALAVTDPSMLPSIVDELTAYNPAAGAVTGVGFVRFNNLVIQADDGGMGAYQQQGHQGWNHGQNHGHNANQMHQPYSTGAFAVEHYQTGPVGYAAPVYPATGFAEGSTPPTPPAAPAVTPPIDGGGGGGGVVSGEIGVVSGEIGSGTRRKSFAPGEMSLAAAPSGQFAPGARVLVSSPDGLLHSSTVRQHSQGYYEVEIGSTGQMVWVPASQVIPE